MKSDIAGLHICTYTYGHSILLKLDKQKFSNTAVCTTFVHEIARITHCKQMKIIKESVGLNNFNIYVASN